VPNFCHTRPSKSVRSGQLEPMVIAVCRKCDALLAAEFHGIQDLLEAGMLADVASKGSMRSQAARESLCYPYTAISTQTAG